MSIETYRQQVAESASFIRNRLNPGAAIGIILGTGSGGLIKYLQEAQSLPYVDIPHFPCSTAPSHQGQLLGGQVGDHQVLVFQGRFHAYEGYSMRQVTYPVRVMAAMGIKILVLTNAAGGLNPFFHKGELMLIRDHINLLGDNPLIGDNLEDWGPRFPDLSAVYDRELICLAQEAALEQGLVLREGVYVALKGPSLETPAETRFLRIIGADAVGMSSVPEAIVGVHAGLRILGVSVLSNVNLPDAMLPIDLQEIIQAVQQAESRLAQLLMGLFKKLPA
jgi:purine-nucleoside phosphorylase